MSIIVLVVAWLASIGAAILVGRSPVPYDQHHSSALLLTGLILCLHAAFGFHPALPSLESPQLFVATAIGYSVLGAVVGYAILRGSIVLGTRLRADGPAS